MRVPTDSGLEEEGPKIIFTGGERILLRIIKFLNRLLFMTSFFEEETFFSPFR